MSNDNYARGVSRFTELFGKTTLLDGELNDFSRNAISHLYGEIWTREGLTLKERSLITIAIAASAGRSSEVILHIKGALHIGISQRTIEEVMIHVSYYAGFPAGREGLANATEAFASADREHKRAKPSET